jgi:O-antigen ligase
LWIAVVFEPQWALAVLLHLTPLLRLPLLLVIAVATMTAMNPEGDWLPDMGLWVGMLIFSRTYALNPIEATTALRLNLFFYITGLGLVRAIKTPRRAEQILFMVCVGQYLWWAFWGLRRGLVSWHPSMANFDGYGPAMAIGIGPAYFYSTAATNPKHKRLAMLTSALCLGGVISSFARGAVLSVVAVVGYIWLRSTRKLRTLGFVFIAAIVIVIAGLLVPGEGRGGSKSNIFAEMMTSFDQGDATGNDRKVLWGLAVRVFEANPVFGAGTGSFGAGAVELLKSGGLKEAEVGGDYALNPYTLYERALHNIYYQILSENGLVGMGLFLGLVFMFWRRNRALKTPEADANWRAAGGTIDIRQVAIGLESGLVAFLTTGYFYNQLLNSWLFAMLFANAMAYNVLYRWVPKQRGIDAPRR